MAQAANTETYSQIKARVYQSFKKGQRTVTTVRKMGMMKYSFNIIRVNATTFVLYKSGDILLDGTTLDRAVTAMFDAFNTH